MGWPPDGRASSGRLSPPGARRYSTAKGTDWAGGPVNMETDGGRAMSIKDRVRSAQYQVDVDAVAEAIVRRLTAQGGEPPRPALEGVLEASGHGGPFGPHT